MPSLPISTAFTDSAVTEAGFKTAITNQREFLADLLGTTGTKLNAVRTLGTLANDVDVKTGAYTVVAADMGKLLLCSGTFTVSLTAAATLGDGFSFIVENNGTGVITIDPNSTEQIDGAATKTLAAGEWCVVTCTGTGFNTFGYTVPIIPDTGVTLLATIAAASGNSVSATGLNLTSYKFLFITYNAIRSTAGSAIAHISSNNVNTVTIGGGQVVCLTGTSSDSGVFGNFLLDLTQSTLTRTEISAINQFKTNITNSSTAIYFRISGVASYNLSTGQFIIYGVK